MLQKKTLDFLAELRENNTRDWFEANRKQYEASKKDVEQLVNQLIAGISTFDNGLHGLEAKSVMFRIFKDVRFSKDKSPYKTNLGAWMAGGGKDSMNAGYYLHVESGDKSFLAGGSYMPPANVLKAIREAIDDDHEGLREILAHKDFVKNFGGLEGETLKTTPKGYDKDHPAIDLLRHKSMVVSHKITDKELVSAGFVEKAVGIYKTMYPLTIFLNRAIAEAKPE
jgi:uncharacterized protein (TIGR02453 family)